MIEKSIFLFLIFLPIFCSCSAISKEQVIAHKIMDSFAAKVKKEENLTMDGTGLSFPDQINYFILRFSSQKKMSIDQSRVLIIKCSQEILGMINSTIEIRHKLSNFPYTGSNLDMIITFFDENGKRVSPPYLAWVSVGDGKIYYNTYDHERKKFIDVHKESYEEALKIVLGNQ